MQYGHSGAAKGSRGILSELMRVGLLIVDQEGAPLFANRLACDLLGCGDEQQAAEAWRALHGELNIDLTSDNVTEPRLLLASVGGAREPLQIEVQPMHSHAFAGAVVLLKDGAADEVLSRELVLASRMRAQNYIFSSLLHDLRAPLNAMEINLELLTDTCHEMRDDFVAGQADVPQRQSDQIVAVLKEELARLNRSLRTVLDNGLPQLAQAEDFDLAMAIRELAVLLRPQARRQHVHIELDIADNSVFIKGQRDQIKQALLNVAINGLEAMPAGGRLRIAVRLCDDDEVETVFSDTGAGIPPELIERVSRVYFTTKSSGTGMGLFVTQLVAETHGGKLAVANSPHGGAVVTLRLPLAVGVLAGIN